MYSRLTCSMQGYLLDDRFCFIDEDSPGDSVTYISLDRVPVRPMTRSLRPGGGLMPLDSRSGPLLAAL